MKFSQNKRLTAILSAIDPCDVFYDICADHGHLAYQVYKTKIADTIIASDILETCVKQMREQYGEYIEVRKGDGFSILDKNDNLDTVLISGVGGKTIIKILEKKEVNFRKYIFSPHKDIEEFREYLVTHNYRVTDDYMVCGNRKYYNIIKCERGQMQSSERYIYFGFNTLENIDFANYLKSFNSYIEEKKAIVVPAFKEKLEKMQKLSRRYFGE